MMMPSIFGENLFDDDWMDFPFDRFDREFFGRKNPLYGKHAKNMMKNGYLTISASKGLDKDEQDKKGKYIRKERYAGTCNRSFYVGDEVTQDDIKAAFKDGVLTLQIPKEVQHEEEQPKLITIE